MQAAVDRRAEAHMEDIPGLLRRHLAGNEHNPLPLDEFIEAYVRPRLERHSCHEPDWRNYIRLLGHLASESATSNNKTQFLKYYWVNQSFINEFQRSLPDVVEIEIFW